MTGDRTRVNGAAGARGRRSGTMSGMTHPDDIIRLGRDEPTEDEWIEDGDADELDLGPDERDADLMDGSWEERYYAGRVRARDWRAIGVAISLLVLLGLLVPAITVLTQ